MADVIPEDTATDSIMKDSTQSASLSVRKRSAEGTTESHASKRLIVEHESNGSSNTADSQPLSHEPQDVTQLQQKVKKLESMFQRACRAAREAELRAEFAENIIDTKAGVKDDARLEKERADKLQKRLDEVSSEMEEMKKAGEVRMAFDKSKIDKLSQKLMEMEYRHSLPVDNSVLEREIALYRENEGLKRELTQMRRIMESMDCQNTGNGLLQERLNLAVNELENERIRSRNELSTVNAKTIEDERRINDLTRKLADYERQSNTWREEMESQRRLGEQAKSNVIPASPPISPSNIIEPDVIVIDGPLESLVFDPIDILKPTHLPDSMPIDAAVSLLRDKYQNECDKKRLATSIRHLCKFSFCPLCLIVTGVNVMEHLVGKKHRSNMIKSGGGVSKTAFDEWMKRMDEHPKEVLSPMGGAAVERINGDKDGNETMSVRASRTGTRKERAQQRAAAASTIAVQPVNRLNVLSHMLYCDNRNHEMVDDLRAAISSLYETWEKSGKKSEIRRETASSVMQCLSCETGALNVDELMEHLKEEEHINKVIAKGTKVCTVAVRDWMETMEK